MLNELLDVVRAEGEPDREYLEFLIRADYERCHPGESLEDMKRRARFLNEDKGLLREWMKLAAIRAAAGHGASPRMRAAE